MLTLIIGGSGSGKSAYAEEYTKRVSAGKKKYYLATMQAFDEECQKKIERHQKLRQGKQFTTIEQPFSIAEALQKIDGKEAVVLLECMTNLTANEMFRTDPPQQAQHVIDKITNDIAVLCSAVSHVIVVTGNVFEDGIEYDAMTMEYIKAMGRINECLAAKAEHVTEVVVGIPVSIK